MRAYLRSKTIFASTLLVTCFVISLMTGCGSPVPPVVPPTALVLTATVPSARVGEVYSGKFTITGGTPPYSYADYRGFPAGMAFDPNTGSITGTPLVARTDITLLVTVQDSGTPAQTATQTSLLVVKPLGVSITTTSLPSGTVNQPYSQTLAAINGLVPYTWAVTAGVLPNGLRLSQTTGTISGTPTTAQTKTFTVTATDSDSPVSKSSRELSIQVQ
jgi:large repetitive protein